MREFYLDNMILNMKPTTLQHKFGVNGKTSGSLAAIAEIKNAVPVLVSPAGCGFHFRSTVRSRNALNLQLECADLQNRDVIFGAEEKLRALLLEIDSRQKPELIFLLPSVVSDVMNDDLAGIAAALQPELHARLVAVPSQAFSHMDKNNSRRNLREKARHKEGGGKFSGSMVYKGCGYVEVMDALVEQVMEPAEQTEAHAVNLESFFWGYGGLTKVRRMQSLLAKIGISVNSFLPANDIAGIRRAPKAALNIVRRKKWALLMQERFGTPFLHIADMNEWHGLEGIRDFYLAVAGQLGLTEQAQRLLEAEERRIRPRYEELRGLLRQHSFCLISGSVAALPELIKAFSRDYGMPVKKVCLVMNPQFQKESGLDKQTLELLHAKISAAMARYGCQGELLLNPADGELRQAAQSCDYLLCGANPRYAALGRPVIPLFLDSNVFDFDSLLEVMQALADRTKQQTPQESALLLNRADFDPVFFPVAADDCQTLQAREMYTRMWRLRSR